MNANRRTTLLACLLGLVPAFAHGQGTTAEYGGRSTAAWIESLSDPDKQLRRRAAYALGQLADPAAVPALVIAADDNQLEVGWYALDALGRIGPAAATAVPAIIEIIEKSGKYVTLRINAAKTLGKIGPDARAAVPLLEQATSGANGIYAVAAAQALHKIDGRKAALTVLGSHLANSDDNVAFAAAMALFEIGPASQPAVKPLALALAHQNADVRRAAARALSRIGLPAVSYLTTALAHPDRFEPTNVIAAFGWIIEDMRTSVLHVPETSREDFKTAAAPLQRQIITPLIAALRDEKPDVRTAASRALARCGPMVVPSLLAVLRGEQVTAHDAAIAALAEMEKYIPADTRQLAGVQWIIEAALPQLTAALRTDDRTARRAAFRLFDALRIGAPGRSAIGPLRQGLRDQDVMIRRYATKSLDRIEN